MIVALLAWDNRHLAPEGLSIVLLNSETGQANDRLMVDRITGRFLSDPVFQIGHRTCRRQPRPSGSRGRQVAGNNPV